MADYIHLMKHCIGLDNAKPYKRNGKLFYKPYRNYFAIEEGCDGFDEWDTMRLTGFADRRNNGKGVFYLTRAGLDYLSVKLGITIYDEEE